MAKLTYDFYSRDTLAVARGLLRKYLVRCTGERIMVCMITDVEAYIGRIDKACHAYNYNRTARNAVMFGPPGRAYVYFIYGKYHCLNLVTEPEGEPCAVLIRGVLPVAGLNEISNNRFSADYRDLGKYQRSNLLNGPGKLCRGLEITGGLNGEDLTGGRLFVCESAEDAGFSFDDGEIKRLQIKAGKRINVDYAEEAVDFPWRFHI